MTEAVDEDQVTIVNFIKFGQEEHMLDLFENGTIYCNTFEYFRTVEDEMLRGDSYEGTFRITNYPPGHQLTLKLPDGREIKLNPESTHLREFYTDIKGNLFCMSAITHQEIVKLKELRLNIQNKRFGSHFVLINNPKEFLRRMKEGFKEAGYSLSCRPVSYYDRHSINDDIGPFGKCHEFEYQREFRVLIKNEKQEPICIRIGTIKDIAYMFEIDKLDELVYKYGNFD